MQVSQEATQVLQPMPNLRDFCILLLFIFVREEQEIEGLLDGFRPAFVNLAVLDKLPPCTHLQKGSTS